jgi:ubiquinol oxidase
MREDGAWIRALLDEAENERMHLMTFVEVTRPSTIERWIVFLLQGVFWNAYFLLYLFWPRTAHRFVRYLEEEAVVSYTHYLAEIDAGRHANGPAPDVAKRYWKLPDDATLRDVIVRVREDEAEHRDVNHGLANALSRGEQTPPPSATRNHL